MALLSKIETCNVLFHIQVTIHGTRTTWEKTTKNNNPILMDGINL